MSDDALFIRCDCHSPEHMMIFDVWHWDNEPILNSQLVFNYNLDPYAPWWKRAWLGFRYALTGKTQRYWWADTVITDDDAIRLYEFLKSYLATTLNVDHTHQPPDPTS